MWTFCAGCDIIIKIQIYMLKSGTPNTIGTSNKVNEVCCMTVSYKKLWKLLIDRDLKKKDLEEMAGVSHYVMNKLTHGDNVTTDVLCKVCKALNCTVDDIMEMIDEQLSLWVFQYRYIDSLATFKSSTMNNLLKKLQES